MKLACRMLGHQMVGMRPEEIVANGATAFVKCARCEDPIHINDKQPLPWLYKWGPVALAILLGLIACVVWGPA